MPQATVAVVLARMDSARLPGKGLRPVGGTTVLDLIADRLAFVADLDAVVVATTDRAVDDPIVDWAVGRGLPVHRGPLDDVASRFTSAADDAGADWAFRVNGDSPFPVPSLLEEAISAADDGTDLVTNLRPRTHPYGVAVELVRVAALREVMARTDITDEDREHVTRALYRVLAEDRIRSVGDASRAVPDGVRLVVDTGEDLEMLRAVLGQLGERSRLAATDELVAAYVEAAGEHAR